MPMRRAGICGSCGARPNSATRIRVATRSRNGAIRLTRLRGPGPDRFRQRRATFEVPAVPARHTPRGPRKRVAGPRGCSWPQTAVRHALHAQAEVRRDDGGRLGYDPAMQPHEDPGGQQRRRDREELRQWRLTKRLLAVVGALVGLLLGMLLQRWF